MAVIADRSAAAARALRDTVRVGSLEIDRAPVTNRRYARFVAETGHRPPLYWPHGSCPASLLDHPVVGVDFFDALAFAFWAGGVLPTEEEWMAAAGGAQADGYAWGPKFEAGRCNTVRSGVKGTTPVGICPEGAAPSGCVDLCGNVWEMTATAFEDTSDSVVVKGGSWYDFPGHARLDARFRARVHKAGNTVGFRLVYGPPLHLPPFLDAGLVAECVAYRHGDAAYHAEDDAETGEFDAIVTALRQTARANLPRVHMEEEAGLSAAAVEEALALLDIAPEPVVTKVVPALPRRPSLPRRLWRACAHLPRATAWRRPWPALRAFARTGLGRTWADRFRAALVEVRRPRPGPSLLACLSAAAGELRAGARPGEGFGGRLAAAWQELRPDPGTPPLWRRLRLAYLELVRLRGVRPLRERWRCGIEILRGPAGQATLFDRLEAAWAALFPPDRSSLKERFLAVLSDRPRSVFLLLTVAVGVVVGVLGAAARDVPGPKRTAVARAMPDEEPGIPSAPGTPPPPRPRLVPAREAPLAGGVQASPAVEEALGDLCTDRDGRRTASEEFLIGRGDEAYLRLKAALRAKLAPDARASVRYVLTAIEEGRATRKESPDLVTDPPRRGLVLFCERVDERNLADVAIVRRTAKAHGLDATVVLCGETDVERLMLEHSAELGSVRLHADPEGSLLRELRVPRLPAVGGLNAQGRLGFLLLGPVDRRKLAQNTARLE